MYILKDAFLLLNSTMNNLLNYKIPIEMGKLLNRKMVSLPCNYKLFLTGIHQYED